MKLLIDFFPIFLFFAAFKIWGIYIATAVAIAATVVQIGYQPQAIQTALDSAGYPKSAAFAKPASLAPPPLASKPSPAPGTAARAPEPDAAQQR